MNTNFSFIKGILVGVIGTTILISSISSVDAVTPYYKSIKALVSSINIVVDGHKIEQNVQPLLIDNTTYLPLRAIGETLSKEVSWDESTNTIFIGNQEEGSYRPSIGLSQLKPLHGETYLNVGYGGESYLRSPKDGGRITLFKQNYYPADTIAFLNSSSVTYHLFDNKYNRIYGLAGVDDSNNNDQGVGIIRFYGDGIEIASIKTGTKKAPPVPFDIDISGIEKLEIKNIKAEGTASRVALVEVILDAVQN
ncbi:stalk domain-containing protein [Bacillus sp. Marseille-P3661]|uniref:stalk domain-containing protein n=1 Tax=Bacillus sp. Marseille-P3661 TaxID=1936234 RepID=UPI000C82B376|nr:stalk domain-containing protein [Bacillus sp. Marseille-P3661]